MTYEALLALATEVPSVPGASPQFMVPGETWEECVGILHSEHEALCTFHTSGLAHAHLTLYAHIVGSIIANCDNLMHDEFTSLTNLLWNCMALQEQVRLLFDRVIWPLGTSSVKQPPTGPQVAPSGKKDVPTKKSSGVPLMSTSQVLVASALARVLAEQTGGSHEAMLPHACSIVSSQPTQTPPCSSGPGPTVPGSGGRPQSSPSSGPKSFAAVAAGGTRPPPLASRNPSKVGPNGFQTVQQCKEMCMVHGTRKTDIVISLEADQHTQFQIGDRPEGSVLLLGVQNSIWDQPDFNLAFRCPEVSNLVLCAQWTPAGAVVVQCNNPLTDAQWACTHCGVCDFLHIADTDARLINRPMTSSLKFQAVPTHGPDKETYSEAAILADLRAHPKWVDVTVVGRPWWIKAKAMSSLGLVGTILVEVADSLVGTVAERLHNSTVLINDKPSHCWKWLFKDSVPQCGACWWWGHVQFNCKLTRVMCAKCVGSHPTSEHQICCPYCKVGKPCRVRVCVNCVPGDTAHDHAATDRECPFFLSHNNLKHLMALVVERAKARKALNMQDHITALQKRQLVLWAMFTLPVAGAISGQTQPADTAITL